MCTFGLWAGLCLRIEKGDPSSFSSLSAIVTFIFRDALHLDLRGLSSIVLYIAEPSFAWFFVYLHPIKKSKALEDLGEA